MFTWLIIREVLVSGLLQLLTSNVTKVLIAKGVDKLLDSKGDGVTKEVATVLLDGIAMSRANDVPEDAFKYLKGKYLQ